MLLVLVVYLHSSLHVSGIVLPKNLWGVISSVWSFVVLSIRNISSSEHAGYLLEMARVGLYHQREEINGLLWNDDDHVSSPAMECRELLSVENEILFVTKCLQRVSQNLHVRGLMLSWNTTILPVVVTFLQWSTFVSLRKKGANLQPPVTSHTYCMLMIQQCRSITNTQNALSKFYQKFINLIDVHTVVSQPRIFWSLNEFIKGF